MNTCTEQNTDCPFRRKNTTCMASIRLFKCLPIDVQKELMNSCIERNWPRDCTIRSEGEQVESILILKSGRVKTVHIYEDGEEHILDVLHEGQAIWHNLFLEENKYNYSILTLSEVQTCEIDRERFMHVLLEHPEACMSLLKMLSTELASAKNRNVLLSIRNPEVRLAGFLLEKHEHCTTPEICLKLQDIADSVNLRPETVSRVLSRMEQEQILKRMGHGRIKVLDPKALQKRFEQ